MSYPKSAEQWWEQLNYHAINIRKLIDKYHPSQHRNHQFKITARAAEQACEVIREGIDQPGPVAVFNVALQTKNAKQLVKVMGDTWFGMPESVDVRSEPSFIAFCDLCSEASLVLSDNDNESGELE